ncbi:glycogen/starch/alpha-glucan phosphorylase [Candidatus Saccharibacteria bacterium]|nr:glycogen/starch/alpha-glucan phosphorylase [Candidatus Saccharibacteria bacterium]
MSLFKRHALENIEETENFYSALRRENFTKGLSEDRPYTYWTIELYDQQNGIRGGGGLGILAADTRRVAERMKIPFTLVTPFYPVEMHQYFEGGKSFDKLIPVDYGSYGFEFVDSVYIKCNKDIVELSVIQKEFGTTRILAVTEPNFRELYSGDSCGDHRLYQEVALGFGGYQALKITGLRPAIMQLNEVATFFAALARLDELASNGMDFYEAVVYTRKHTLYTNHTLVQAAEASYSFEQFEKYVFPNLKSKPVKKWLSDKFINKRIRLSDVTIEIAEMRSGVSKLHTRVADYHDLAGEKVKFKAITNGIDIPYWVLPDTVKFYVDSQILDTTFLPTDSFIEQTQKINAEQIREIKRRGRRFLNRVLSRRPDHLGRNIELSEDAIVFDFKRRFVDYKRPWLPFSDLRLLKDILEKNNAEYILTGRVHTGDERMMARLNDILGKISKDDYLREHVHYIPDYDEELARALSVGSNVSINVPIVGLEACGTSWEKDVANMCLLVSTHDGGVADCPSSSYLNVSGETEGDEIDDLYRRMREGAEAWGNDFDLEFWVRKQLECYLPVVSGARMMKDYLDYLFKNVQ